jgi:hypothetical protein
MNHKKFTGKMAKDLPDFKYHCLGKIFKELSNHDEFL